MGDGNRLAIAIAVLFLAGIAFFFAFHPSGVQGATNPDNALSWLMNEFQTTAGVETAGPSNAPEPTAADAAAFDQYEGLKEKSYVPPQTKDVGPNGG